ncbi:MAG TPA: hypothetical protein VN784_17605 [Candidatus Limnocylindrales bacterium]|nr:hypothetical protein [Candidatus Limnocylindrales bacterium]
MIGRFGTHNSGGDFNPSNSLAAIQPITTASFEASQLFKEDGNLESFFW